MKLAEIVNITGDVPQKVRDLQRTVSKEAVVENEARNPELMGLLAFVEHEAHHLLNGGKPFKIQGKFDKSKKGLSYILKDGLKYKVIPCEAHGSFKCILPERLYNTVVQVQYDRAEFKKFCTTHRIHIPPYLWKGISQVRELFAFSANLVMDFAPEYFLSRQSISTLEMRRGERYGAFAFRLYGRQYMPLPKGRRDVFYSVKGLEKAFLLQLVRILKQNALGKFSDLPFIKGINYVTTK